MILIGNIGINFGIKIKKVPNLIHLKTLESYDIKGLRGFAKIKEVAYIYKLYLK